MALLKEDLLAIGDLFEEKLEQKLEEKLEQILEEKLEQKLEEKLEQKFEEKLAPIYKRLDKQDSDLEILKENTDITREAVNALGEWADAVSHYLQIDYPVKAIEL